MFSIIIFISTFYLINPWSLFSKNTNNQISNNPTTELLFDIKNPNNISKIIALLNNYNPQIYKAFPHLKDTSLTHLDDFYAIDILDSSQSPLLKATLKQSGLINGIEENEIIKIEPKDLTNFQKNNFPIFYSHKLNDPLLQNVWNFNLFDYDDIVDYLSNVTIIKKSKIFILDTGVDASHEDLKDNYISINKSYDKDTDKHGTHCAGIAGSVSNNSLGIASFNTTNNFTTITSITVLPKGRGTKEAIIDGIILATDNGADVISMSLGGLANSINQRSYNQAIKYANNNGAIVVVAAGNENANAMKYIPASCKGVITVSAIDKNINKASFSNFVNDIKYKVAAPGVNIYSTVPNNTYEFMDGTSMAAPYVSGLIGIMKALNPDLTTDQVFQILDSTGKDTANTAETGRLIQPTKALIATYSNKSLSFYSSFLRFRNKLLLFENKKNKKSTLFLVKNTISKTKF